MSIITVNKVKLKEEKNKEAQENRNRAFVTESDPLLYKALRGEIDMEIWKSKVEEIRNRFPYLD